MSSRMIVSLLLAGTLVGCPHCGESGPDREDQVEMIVDPEIYLDELSVGLSETSPKDDGFFYGTHEVVFDTEGEPKGVNVGFHVKSSDFVPRLQFFFGKKLIREVTGSEILSNMTGKPEFWEISFVEKIQTSGTYRLRVTSTTPGATGTYDISAWGAFQKPR